MTNRAEAGLKEAGPRIMFPAGDLPLGSVDERAALAILEALFGLSDLPGFDSLLFEEHAIRGMASLVTTDYAAACLVRETVRRARRIRAENKLPPDLGYRREAVRVAGRVFETVAGRTVRGEGPLVDVLVREGAVRAEVTPAAMVVTVESGAPPPAPPPSASGGAVARSARVAEESADTLAFELGSPVPTARYRFSGAELDAFARRAIAAAYPRNFRETLKREASDAGRAVQERLAADPKRSAVEALAVIQAGAADGKGETRGRFDAVAAASFLDGRDSGRSQLIGDFLAEVAAFRKFVPARRNGEKSR